MREQIHSGGCQCGAIRYRATGAVGNPHVCHCRMCQRKPQAITSCRSAPSSASGSHSCAASRNGPLLRSGEARFLRPLRHASVFSTCRKRDFIIITLGSLTTPPRSSRSSRPISTARCRGLPNSIGLPSRHGRPVRTGWQRSAREPASASRPRHSRLADGLAPTSGIAP